MTKVRAAAVSIADGIEYGAVLMKPAELAIISKILRSDEDPKRRIFIQISEKYTEENSK